MFTLSCCHKHFGLRCSTEHLVHPARQHYAHWWMLMCLVWTPETWRMHWSAAKVRPSVCGQTGVQPLCMFLSLCLWRSACVALLENMMEQLTSSCKRVSNKQKNTHPISDSSPECTNQSCLFAPCLQQQRTESCNQSSMDRMYIL